MRTAARFWQWVEWGSPGACWPWLAGRTPNGYGKVRWFDRIEGAHRVAFFLETGRWPVVCRHTCDTPLCCNPAHLLDGTYADNTADAAARDRLARFDHRGERNPRSLVSDAETAELRRAYAAGATARTLSRLYGLSYSQVRAIVTGRKRAHPVTIA